jgi:hypothetical protein
MTIITNPETPVPAGTVRAGEVFACVEAEKRGFPRRLITVDAIRCAGSTPVALCTATTDGEGSHKTRIALYRLINPTKFRLVESPATISSDYQASC